MQIPLALESYMRGLRTHDTEMIAATLDSGVRFVTPTKVMNKVEIIAFLNALYRGFPDWSYANDDPERLEDGSFRVKWRQRGTHTGRLAFPGFEGIEATGRKVVIPPHYFFYRIADERIVEIRPDPIPGGAPRGIFEQIGVERPPL